MAQIDYTLPLDRLPDPLPIEPLSKPFDATITPPGSKSITCRAYVLAALAEGESRIVRPLRADDTDGLLKALCTLGAEARWEGDDVLIKGVAGRFPRGGSVNLGDGGTPTRFMIACACLAAEPVIVDGSKRMRERPIAEGVDMLRNLGAAIDYAQADGRLPVKVKPNSEFRGGELAVGRTVSSQFISAVLLIAPFLECGVAVRHSDSITSASYVDLTLGVLAEWEARYDVIRNVLKGGIHAHIVRCSPIAGRAYPVSQDASSGAYWLTASAIVPSARLELGDNSYADQPDAKCLHAMRDAGVEFSDCYARFFAVGPPSLQRFQFDAGQSPDGALALAVLASRCDGRSRLTGLHTLRVKETDRIAALANELRKVGCAVKTGEDWIEITPSRGSSDPVIIETYNDHRMAMAFAILGLVRPGLSIRNPGCVAKSYPGFWKDFAKLYQ